MNRRVVFLIVVLLCLSLNGIGQRLSWPLGNISVDKLDQSIKTYHMFDTTGLKVGSMVTQVIVDEDKITFLDTSRFDNGSVYEDARFVFSKNPDSIMIIVVDVPGIFP